MSLILISRLPWTFALLITLVNGLRAQGVLCTSDETGCTEWTRVLSSQAIHLEGGCYVEYEADVRLCNGIAEFRIVSVRAATTPGNNCAALLSLNIDEFSISALMEKIDYAIIASHLSSTLPLCNNRGQVVKIYSASCGAWVKCSWNLQSNTPDCDPGYLPIPEPPASGQIDSWHYQPCGIACCKRTYTACRDPLILIGPFLTRELVIKAEQKEQIGDCTLQSTYGANPCLHGC